MKQKFTLILFCITVLSIAGFSQTGKSVVIGTMVNKPNAVLVLNPPDGNQGFLLPQVTTANRISIVPASPSEDGLVVYDITDKAFYFWKDGQWNKGLGGSQTLTYDQLTQKLSISNGNVVDLATLKEIPSVSGQAGKYITTDGTTLSWATLSNLGDITSIITGKGLAGGVSSGDATLSVKTDNSTISFNGSDELQLSDGSVSVPKIVPGTPGTILVTDAGGLVKWQTGSGTDNQNLSLTGNTLNITNGSSANLNSVTASGQVGGTLNNLIIAPNTVTGTMIQDGTIQTNDIGTLTIAGTNIANATISSSKLNLSGVTSGTYGSATQVAQFNVDPQGRVTSAGNVAITGISPVGSAGGDLAGNYPTPTIASSAGNNIVSSINNPGTSTTINANRLTSAVVLDSEILPAGDISGSFLAGLQLTANSVTSAEIANAAITDLKIASGVTVAKLSPSSTNGQILTTVAGATIWADNAALVASGVTAGSYGTTTQVPSITVDAQGRITNATNLTLSGVAPGGPAGNDLSGTYPNPSIANSAVNSAKILDGSVTSIDINDATILTADLADNAVTTLKILNGAVTATKLANTSVTAGSYGTSSQVSQIVVDGQGRITSANNVAIAGVSPGGAASGDLTGSFPNPTIAVTAGTNVVNSINNAATVGTINTARLASAVVLDTESAVGGDISGTFSGGLQINPNTITSVEISNAAVTDIKIVPGITASKLAASVTDGQVLTTVAGVTTWSTLPGLTSTGVGAGTYGTSNQVSQITVDAQGRITNASNVLITGVLPGGSAGGDLTGSYPIPTISTGAGPNIASAISTSAIAGAIPGSKINPNFVNQNITTSGNISATGTGTLSIGGASTLSGTLAVAGATTLSNLGGGTNMVVAGPTGLLSTQPIPAVLTQGNLTTITTGLSITGGTNAVIGSGTTVNIQNATGSQPGLLTAADFTTFNNKIGLTTTPAAGNISGSFSTGLQIVPGSANQVLITNGSSAVQWVNQSSLAGALSLTGDVTGALNANTVTRLQGINVSTTNPTDQQVLQYDNATSRWRPATVASITPTAFKMRQTFNQTINSTEMLIWDDEEYDDGGNNFFSNVFHVPSSGLYHFDAIVTFQNVMRDDDVEVILRVGGTDEHRAYGNTGHADTNVSVSISTDIKLNAGDQVTLWGVTQNNRQTMGNPVRTQFSGRKVY